MSRRNRPPLLLAIVALVFVSVATTYAGYVRSRTDETELSPMFRRQLDTKLREMTAPRDLPVVDDRRSVQQQAFFFPSEAFSACLASGCAGSACAGSACAASGCGGSGCVGSGCAASGCAGSACIGSGCGGSACVGSVCGGSVCGGSVCSQSVCGGSACGQSVCGGSACSQSVCGGSACPTCAAGTAAQGCPLRAQPQFLALAATPENGAVKIQLIASEKARGWYRLVRVSPDHGRRVVAQGITVPEQLLTVVDHQSAGSETKYEMELTHIGGRTVVPLTVHDRRS